MLAHTFRGGSASRKFQQDEPGGARVSWNVVHWQCAALQGSWRGSAGSVMRRAVRAAPEAWDPGWGAAGRIALNEEEL